MCLCIFLFFLTNVKLENIWYHHQQCVMRNGNAISTQYNAVHLFMHFWMSGGDDDIAVRSMIGGDGVGVSW